MTKQVLDELLSTRVFIDNGEKVPKLASAAENFFKIGIEGKRFRPTA